MAGVDVKVAADASHAMKHVDDAVPGLAGVVEHGLKIEALAVVLNAQIPLPAEALQVALLIGLQCQPHLGRIGMLDGVAEAGLNDGQDFMRNAVSGKRQRGLLADPELRVGQLPVQYKAFALKRGLQPPSDLP